MPHLSATERQAPQPVRLLLNCTHFQGVTSAPVCSRLRSYFMPATGIRLYITLATPLDGFI